MAKAKIGAVVQYCGHKAVFLADIYKVGDANVVRSATKQVTMENVNRTEFAMNSATHHLVDFPNAGFWRPDLGVFVVPEDQVIEL